MTRINRSIIQAILAALLFGTSAPIAKILLGKIDPVVLAALVYLGSGIGLAIYKGVQRIILNQAPAEAPVVKQDIPWLAGAIFAGGVAAPIVLMLGLRATPAATASLLLNFEGVATALIAGILFKEAVGKRIWWAIGLITLASIILSLDFSGKWGISIGAMGILAACILWGFDNNLTRNISGKDPVAIVMIKGLIAGSFSAILAIIAGSSFPSISSAITAMIFGCFSYGLSIVFFVLALRGLGAARTSAFFGAAPFIGAVISLIVFHTIPDIRFIASLPLMIAGAIMILNEEHSHIHTHEPLEHDHLHTHMDNHHNHPHEDDNNEPHSHSHKHETIEHSHPHTPDDHHRHTHPQ